MKKIAIIGAGASGLITAYFCAKNGIKVDIFEQNDKIGKKILASGNGRCNISNTNLSIDDYFSENYGFVEYAFKEFGFLPFKKFVNSLGLFLDEKEDGRVYPLSNEAKSVVNLFSSQLHLLGVHFYFDTKIKSIKEVSQKYDAVVVATGSQAAPRLGGNDSGVLFAKELGLSYITSYPSLVQLHLKDETIKKMAGVKIDGEVTLFIERKKEITMQGDILFTNYGVSGFAILDISQKASKALLEQREVVISINFLPKFSRQQIGSLLMQTIKQNPNMEIFSLLIGLIPLKVVNFLLKNLKISPSTLGSNIGTKMIKKIASSLSDFRFLVTDTHGFSHAEVSGGGIDTKEINPKTMQSLKHKNIYFCGEVVDVVGKRGGYNFAWAWASGYLVAQNILKG